MREIRAAHQGTDGKQIVPLAPGIVLKYPLSGLVRCGLCGAAMQPSKSGAKSTSAASYYYYRCPVGMDRRCDNRFYIPGNWLWQVLVDLIRNQLFPTAEDDVAEPPWLEELLDEVRAELLQAVREEGDRRPLLERELADLDGNIQGWTQSLASTNLSGQARQHVEQQLNAAVERRQHVEVDLQALTGLADRVDELIDGADVLEMVRHLETILASGNPTEVNAELMQHIDRILVFPEGRVVIRCSRLGVWGAVGDRIVASSEQDDTCNRTNGNNHDCFAVRQRPLPTRRICRGFDAPQITSITGGPGTLPDKWIIEYEFQFERPPAWVEEYADEVRRRHDETGHSLNALAREFGKSRPTIKRALEIAEARAGDGDDDA